VTVTVDVMDLKGVLHVCEHMRAPDWAEVVNLLPAIVTTPEQIALICMSQSRFGLVARVDGVPAAVCQFVEILDGTWRVGLFGTDQFTAAIWPLLDDLVENTLPYLMDDLGAVYLEAQTDPLHPDAAKLLRALGFAKVGILPEYGSRGRDIALYVLTKGEANVLRNGRWRKFRAPAVAAGSRSDRNAEGLPQAAG
jgi:hypothetical protein